MGICEEEKLWGAGMDLQVVSYIVREAILEVFN